MPWKLGIILLQYKVHIFFYDRQYTVGEIYHLFSLCDLQMRIGCGSMTCDDQPEVVYPLR